MNRPHDQFIGKTIGRLTFHNVIKKGRIYYFDAECQCNERQNYRVYYIYKLQKNGRKFECTKCKLRRKSKIIEGKTYGRWTVIEKVKSKDNHHTCYLARCECGFEKIVIGSDLVRKSKASRSCGCLARKLQSKWSNTTQFPPAHGMRKSNPDNLKKRLYNIRNRMNAACYNPKNARYKANGAKGYTVCDLWRNGAVDFVSWGLKNGFEEWKCLHLKDGRAIFSPENCEFISKKHHRASFIEWKGEIKTLSEWSKFLNIPISSLCVRLTKYRNKFTLDQIFDKNFKFEQ
jgi:hypothetical protein